MDIPDTVEKKSLSGPIVIATIVILLIAATIWVLQDKKHQQEKDAVLRPMETELTADEQLIKDERLKYDEMTKAVEDQRAQTQIGNAKERKAAVDQFNKLAADQRAEHEKFAQMADQYNQKLAKFKELQQ